MRFAITATDRYFGVLQALIEHGWQPLKLFITPVDRRMHLGTLMRAVRQLFT